MMPLPPATIMPGGSQTVTGEWKHKVSAKNHDDYGTWQTDVGGTWTGKFGGDVSLTSDTNFNIKAPTAKITSTDMKMTIAALTFQKTLFKHELYFYKGQSGIVKNDHAAITKQLYGLKAEYCFIKLDHATLTKENIGTKTQMAAAVMLTAFFIRRGAAAYVRNAAISRI